MKKIFALLLGLILSMTAFGACNKVAKVIPLGEKQMMTMRAYYDYGYHVADKATLLLDGCNVFFNPADYGITELLAGDVVTITYRGECYIQETYPGTVVTKDMKIIDVAQQKAKILELEVWQVPGGGYNVIYNGGSVGCDNTYVINADGSFEELGEHHVNQTLYGTDFPLTPSFEIKALYSYNPRPNETPVTPPDDHVHSLVCLEEVEPTCLSEGRVVIGCTYGDYIYEERVLEKVECQLDEDGKCIWCEKKLSDFYTWINDLTAEDIESMQIDDVTYGVAPGMRVNSRVKSRDAQDKENIIAYLKDVELKAVSAEIAAIDGGGGEYLMIFYANSEDVCGVAIHNGYFYINGIYYQPSLQLPMFGENAMIVQACCLCGSFDCLGHE